MTQTFDHLLLLGRPAAGKSEFIDFMKKTSDNDRARDFHIGNFEELDDFVWLWEKFVEDDLWQAAGFPRLYSDKFDGGRNCGLKSNKGELFDFMFARFNHEAKKHFLNRSDFYHDGTLVIEFARGGKDGYTRALPRLSNEILERAAILYVKVSYEESCRRNEARYREKLAHSVLAHKVPDETLDHFYRLDDWDTLTQERKEGVLDIKGIHIPFVTMLNEPELTEREPLAKRYGSALQKLWQLYKHSPS